MLISMCKDERIKPTTFTCIINIHGIIVWIVAICHYFFFRWWTGCGFYWFRTVAPGWVTGSVEWMIFRDSHLSGSCFFDQRHLLTQPRPIILMGINVGLNKYNDCGGLKILKDETLAVSTDVSVCAEERVMIIPCNGLPFRRVLIQAGVETCFHVRT